MCIQYGIADIYIGLELYSRLVLGGKHTLVGIYVGVFGRPYCGRKRRARIKDILYPHVLLTTYPSRVVRRNLKGETIIINFTVVTIDFVFQDDN